MFVWVCLRIFVWHMRLIHVFVFFVHCRYMRSWIGVGKKQSTDVCFNIHTPTGRYLHVDAFGLTCWSMRNALYSIILKPCTEIWMMNYARFVFNTVCWFWWQSHTWTRRYPHAQRVLIIWNILEWHGFLQDFQHGILNPWNPRFGCHFRLILRRPPPLREEVRFLGTLGRLPINWGYV